jgi:hypothetical protein
MWSLKACGLAPVDMPDRLARRDARPHQVLNYPFKAMHWRFSTARAAIAVKKPLQNIC